MKKIILLLFGMLLIGNLSAQKPFVFFGHIPDNLFTAEQTADRTIKVTGTFLWSLDAVVSGAEITINKETKTFETAFLSGVGGAVGYKNYKPLTDGTIVSNWGVSLAILTKVKLNDIIDTRMKLALLANLYNITAGPVYTFGDNKLGLLVGANINF
jgi:hypothetical protein